MCLFILFILFVFLIILHLLQYFLEDFFVPLGWVALLVKKVSKLTGKFAFEVVIVQPVCIDGSVVYQCFDFLSQLDATVIRILKAMFVTDFNKYIKECLFFECDAQYLSLLESPLILYETMS